MYSSDLKKISTLGLVLIAVVGLVGCSSAKPTDDPNVDRVGKYLLMSKLPDFEVVIGYRHAQQSLGAPWLLLEVAMTSPSGEIAVVERKNVSVQTPDGTTIPLATQREFNEDYGTLQSFIRSADVVRDPMDYWPPRKEICPIEFFVQPGTAISYDQVTVSDLRACQGRFLFKIPGGVQPGRYVLNINVKDGKVSIPMTFEN